MHCIVDRKILSELKLSLNLSVLPGKDQAHNTVRLTLSSRCLQATVYVLAGRHEAHGIQVRALAQQPKNKSGSVGGPVGVRHRDRRHQRQRQVSHSCLASSRHLQ